MITRKSKQKRKNGKQKIKTKKKTKRKHNHKSRRKFNKKPKSKKSIHSIKTKGKKVEESRMRSGTKKMKKKNKESLDDTKTRFFSTKNLKLMGAAAIGAAGLIYGGHEIYDYLNHTHDAVLAEQRAHELGFASAADREEQNQGSFALLPGAQAKQDAGVCMTTDCMDEARAQCDAGYCFFQTGQGEKPPDNI